MINVRCFQCVIAMCEPMGGTSALIPPKKYDILTPIRQARNYLFVRRQKFLFRFDECAPILQPNLKAGVNLFDIQRGEEGDDEDAFDFKSPCGHIPVRTN